MPEDDPVKAAMAADPRLDDESVEHLMEFVGVFRSRATPSDGPVVVELDVARQRRRSVPASPLLATGRNA